MTSLALDLQQPGRAGIWLFDCGEGTQHQFLKTALNPGKVDKIFITHLHGDHLFGLPGLLCSRSMQSNSTLPLTLYGPKGLREFVEMALRLSGSWTDYPMTIHEITAGEVFDDGQFSVTAWPLSHPVECYGYRIVEHDKPGALNAAALREQGIPPGPLFQRLKRGERVQLKDGRIINGQDFLEAPQRGKTLAIFGDTSPCPAALELARGADLMVHETTLEDAMAEKANARGHSTSRQTARLAKEAGVGRLVVTHVSSRYNIEGCQQLLNECREVFRDTDMAEDFSIISL